MNMDTEIKTLDLASRLPKKLSDLLEAAVADAEKIELTGEINGIPATLDMGVWVAKDGKKCEVCMAGAMLLGHAGVTRAELGADGELSYSDETLNRMRAVDDLRTGDFGMLDANCTDAEGLALYDACEMISAAYNPEDQHAPWDVYRRAVGILRGAGL
jgi:hypothetical protein